MTRLLALATLVYLTLPSAALAADEEEFDPAHEWELQEWVPRIEGLSEATRETHVLMNNCYRDFAVRNARDLGSLLDLDLPE